MIQRTQGKKRIIVPPQAYRHDGPKRDRRWWQRWILRLYPWRDVYPKSVPQLPHGLYVVSRLRWGFVDRLRILFGAGIKVECIAVWKSREADAKTYVSATIIPPLCCEPPAQYTDGLTKIKIED